MQDFFDFFAKNSTGILLVLLSIFVLVYFLNALAKLFGWGRYKKLPSGPKELPGQTNNWGFVLSQFFLKIITDFRSFLALFLVVIFACTLLYAISISKKDASSLSAALQAVMSTLGGLVGSIVGYYFGESSARNKNSNANSSDANVAVLRDTDKSIPGIKETGAPPLGN